MCWRSLCRLSAVSVQLVNTFRPVPDSSARSCGDVILPLGIPLIGWTPRPICMGLYAVRIRSYLLSWPFSPFWPFSGPPFACEPDLSCSRCLYAFAVPLPSPVSAGPLLSPSAVSLPCGYRRISRSGRGPVHSAACLLCCSCCCLPSLVAVGRYRLTQLVIAYAVPTLRVGAINWTSISLVRSGNYHPVH